MSKTFSLYDLLVNKYGITMEEATMFVDNLFLLVRERLETDKVVKIKGLGTFKLSEMNARESIDINTRERILIEGRQKLTFTPENTVRDRINSPFAQFESVDLDEDFDISSIDEKYEPQNSLETEEENTVSSQPIENANGEEEVAVEDVIVDEETAVYVDEEECVELMGGDNTHEDDMIEDGVDVDVPEASEATSVTTETTVETPEVRSPNCEKLINEGINQSRKIIHLLYGLLALIVIGLIIFGAYFCYQLGLSDAQKEVENKAAAKPKVVDVKPKVIKAISTDTLEKKDTLKNDTVVFVEPKTDIENLQKEYNKDVRVRTGAYRIVGIDTTVTLKEGQTFAGICKAYLGEGMECYVEVFNDGMTTAKVGDAIKIPKLKHKKKK